MTSAGAAAADVIDLDMGVSAPLSGRAANMVTVPTACE
jgi:hypothetical protein